MENIYGGKSTSRYNKSKMKIKASFYASLQIQDLSLLRIFSARNSSNVMGSKEYLALQMNID